MLTSALIPAFSPRRRRIIGSLYLRQQCQPVRAEDARRGRAFELAKGSQEEPVLWSNSFVGFGIKRHKSPATGRESDWMRIGFAPRKTNLSLYFGNYVGAHAAALEKLGKYKTGMGCLYIHKLADIDLKVLKGMMEKGWTQKRSN